METPPSAALVNHTAGTLRLRTVVLEKYKVNNDFIVRFSIGDWH